MLKTPAVEKKVRPQPWRATAAAKSDQQQRTGREAVQELQFVNKAMSVLVIAPIVTWWPSV
jgi:hypothetical protein